MAKLQRCHLLESQMGWSLKPGLRSAGREWAVVVDALLETLRRCHSMDVSFTLGVPFML